MHVYCSGIAKSPRALLGKEVCVVGRWGVNGPVVRL